METLITFATSAGVLLALVFTFRIVRASLMTHTVTLVRNIDTDEQLTIQTNLTTFDDEKSANSKLSLVFGIFDARRAEVFNRFEKIRLEAENEKNGEATQLLNDIAAQARAQE